MKKARCPSTKECYKMLADYHTPAHVIGHCEAVSETAVKIAEALNRHGHDLNVDLIKTAGLLHDIARVEPEHHIVGGEYIKKLGYPEVAEIISVHMVYKIEHSVAEADETDLVCLGDRLVEFDKYVGLEERMNYIINKNKDRPHVKAIIEKAKVQLKAFIDGIEAEIGQSIDELMGLNDRQY